jgi:hypothetical protein
MQVEEEPLWLEASASKLVQNVYPLCVTTNLRKLILIIVFFGKDTLMV